MSERPPATPISGAAVPAPVDAPRRQLGFAGRGGEMFKIALVNSLISLVTLTIYRFWARTRVRRYLWSSVRLMDEPFEYTGTGRELFIGFLAALFLVILPLAVIYFLATFLILEEAPELEAVLNVLAYVVIFFLIGAAIYRARRYRLSRTHWRGIHGGQSGSAVRYGLKYLGFMVLNILTAAWTYPWTRMRLMRQMMNNTWFGDRRFVFEGGAGPLYKRFALAWVAIVLVPVIMILLVTLVVFLFEVDFALLFEELAEGLSENGAGEDMGTEAVLAVFVPVLVVFVILFSVPAGIVWYKAHEFRYMASCAGYEGLGFELDSTFGSLLWLIIGNYLITAFTLGFGVPFAQMRRFRYVCDRLSIRGQADFEAIRQSSEARPGVGEGLAEAFDLGAV